MVMDYLRTSYRRKAKIFQGSDQLVTLSWYPAPPGAKIFPGHHLFASGDWCDKNYEWPGLGEQRLPRRHWSSGRNLRPYQGQCFVGEREWYDTGVPLSAIPQTPLPPCCLGPILVGPLSFDGAAVVSVGRGAIFPSLLLTGHAPVFHRVAHHPRGGLGLGGRARHTHIGLQSGVGSMVFDAPAVSHPGFVRPFTGGLAFGKQARSSRVGEESGFGGLSFTGSAPLTVVLSMRPTGGIRLGGAALTFHGRMGPRTGAVELGGIATVEATGQQSAAGGVSFDGHLRSSRVGEQSGFGGVRWNGSASVSTGSGDVATAICASAIPKTLTGIFTIQSGCFASFPTTFTFTWQSGFIWRAAFPTEGDGTVAFLLDFSGTGPTGVRFSCDCVSISAAPPILGSCAPQSWEFQSIVSPSFIHCGLSAVPSSFTFTVTP